MAKKARLAYQSFAERFGERVRELCSQWMRCPRIPDSNLVFTEIPTAKEVMDCLLALLVAVDQ